MDSSTALPFGFFLFQAYLLGWAVAAPIGPVNLEIIRRAIRVRLAAGFFVGLGATMVDLGYFLLVTIGLGPILLLYARSTVGLIIGGTILVIVALLSLHAAWLSWKGKVPAEMAPGDIPKTRHLLFNSWLTGVGMTALNPMTIFFWVTLPGFLLHGAPEGKVFLVAAGFAVWLGAFSWVVMLIGILKFARRYIGPRMFAVVSAGGGLIILALAIKFWLSGAQFLGPS
jgi:threonine/homoserine/homoserine lactone efflux protein